MNSEFTVIALGSNLGDKADNLQRAAAACKAFMEVSAVSKIYRTEPMYMTDQPDFLNMALCGYCDLQAMALLQNLKAVEREFGRQASVRYGPRIIDLDIIFFGENVIKENELIIPHPKLAERDFVLAPLIDICADFTHPELKLSVRQLYATIESHAEVA